MQQDLPAFTGHAPGGQNRLAPLEPVFLHSRKPQCPLSASRSMRVRAARPPPGGPKQLLFSATSGTVMVDSSTAKRRSPRRRSETYGIFGCGSLVHGRRCRRRGNPEFLPAMSLRPGRCHPTAFVQAHCPEAFRTYVKNCSTAPSFQPRSAVP